MTKLDQAWVMDMTYIRLPHGFVYLVAVLDWYSRYVLSWAVSVSLDTTFCLDALAATRSLGQYFRFYNQERLHQSLGYRTPAKDFRHSVLFSFAMYSEILCSLENAFH